MTRKKVCSIINEISDKYHFVPIDGELLGKHFPNNLVLMSLSYILDRNHLLIGEPGWGKTTVAQILSSKFSGIPLDLYESLAIEGHPGLFTEKWKARPHYGELTKGKEKVIWQGCFGLDTLIVDEINRVSPDVQDEMLEGIRTGRWTYMNDVLFEGKKPTFFTKNYRDDGNGEIIPPLEDRIDIVTEEKAGSPLNDYSLAEERIRKNLCNPNMTTEAIDALREMNFSKFKDIIKRSKKGDYLTYDEKLGIQEQIKSLPFSNDANYLLWTLICEVDFNQKYGTKRSSDPVSDHDHDKKYAGINVKSSFSARPQMASRLYSQGLAWLFGQNEVQVDHVAYILPYVSAHRLNFTDTYRDLHGNDDRVDYEDLHLAKKLVEQVHGNEGSYEKSIKPLKDLVSKLQKGKVKKLDNNQIDIDGVVKNIDDYDHPLIRHLIEKKVLEPKSDL